MASGRNSVGVICATIPAAAAEMLIAAERRSPRWSHPRNVLTPPYPDLGEVLAACRRLHGDSAGGRRRLIEEVVAKLERAVRLDQKARERREAMQNR